MYSKNIRSALLILVTCILSTTIAAAPDTIRGVVTDSLSRFSIGQVTVSAKGRTATTDANGSFSIIFPTTHVTASPKIVNPLDLNWHAQNGSFTWSPHAGAVTIVVQDTRGRLVKSRKFATSSARNHFLVGNLPSGIYTAMLRYRGKKDVYRFFSSTSGVVGDFAGTTRTLTGVQSAYAFLTSTGQSHTVLFTKTGYATKTVAIAAGTKDSIGIRLCAHAGTSGIAYYVSPTGNDDSNNGKSALTPFKNAQKAHDVMIEGDTCKVMPGTYNYSGSGEYLVITRSGKANGHIRYQAYDPANRPVVKLNLVGSEISTYVGWGAIKIKGASYIDISGFILTGANDNLTVAKGEEVRAYYMAEKAKNNSFATCDWQYVNTTNTNGISIDKNGTAYNHHLTISNCEISRFAGCGIGLSNADYVLVDNNICFDNSWYTLWPTSGITVSTGYNSDSYTGFKTIVSNNVCYNNKAFIKWEYNNLYTDGNGIIADVNRGDIVNPVSPTETYNGKTLFVNNICYNNGGSGLHAFGAVNVWFVNNVAYNNATRSVAQGAYANIFANESPNNRFLNNISITGVGNKNYDQNLSEGTTWSSNFSFGGGTNAGISSGIIEQDPLFTGPFTNLTSNIASSFKVGSSSPCIDAGFSFPSFATDINGRERPLRAGYDSGAFEFP